MGQAEGEVSSSESIPELLSREELKERLRLIADDTAPIPIISGAMCYCPSHIGFDKIYEKSMCVKCGKEYVYSRDSFLECSRSVNRDRVTKMREIGYDVKSEFICKECAEKIVKELYSDIDNDETEYQKTIKKLVYVSDRNCLFSFRTNDSEPYHLALTDNEYCYRALYALMENDRLFFWVMAKVIEKN